MRKSLLLFPLILFTLGTWAQSARMLSVQPVHQESVLAYEIAYPQQALLRANAVNTPQVPTSGPSTLSNEEDYIRCGVVEYEAWLTEQLPYRATTEDFERWMSQKLELVANSDQTLRATYEVPYIFHVVHSGESVGTGSNLSNAIVNAQMSQLNDDYKRLNSDAGNTPGVFLASAGSIDLLFIPAVINESGDTLPEPGIDRVNGLVDFGISDWEGANGNNNANLTLKPGTFWDPTLYMNIWSCNLGGNLLGFAQYPSGPNNPTGVPAGGDANTDGVVLLDASVGSIALPGASTYYGFGRTATHEVGHWLGLRHIWGDGNCFVDDYCTDTPAQGASSENGVPSHPGCTYPDQNTCPGGASDQFMNYMDYTADACMNLFTNDQIARVDIVLNNSIRRLSLLSSNVGGNGSGGGACLSWINPTPSTGWVDFNNMFGGAPCDDGTGCAFNEITVYEVYAAEAYSVDGFVMGESYTFSMCNGPGAGAWVPEFTIIAPSGAIDASGAGDGDGCSMTWTASEDGTYLIVINEAGACGGGGNTATDNGFPALQCNGNPGPECPPQDTTCSAGTLAADDSVGVCTGQVVTMETNDDESIPVGGDYRWEFAPGVDGTGGTGGTISIFGGGDPFTSYTFDAGLNGLLAQNTLPDLAGTWILTGFSADATETECDRTPTSRAITFVDSTGNPLCAPVTCEAGTLSSTSTMILCPGEFITVETNGDEGIPGGGGYGMQFEPGIDGTGGTGGQVVITGTGPSYNFDAGLNGLLEFNLLPPLNGTWAVRGVAYSNSADPLGSICDTTTETKTIVFLDSTFINDVTVMATSCNPVDTGTTVQNLTNEFGCDSVVTTITTLLPSDAITFFDDSCDPADTGTAMVTLTNQYGCDSVVTTITSLLPSDAVTLFDASCDPADTGTAIVTLLNVFGCDSVVTTITSLIESYDITIDVASCDPADTGSVVQNLISTTGCDSVVTTITALLPSDDITINATSCDPGNVGTVIQDLTNIFGCDSTVTTITTLLPSDDILIVGESCNPADTGTVVQNLTNVYGCDSIVTTVTGLLPSDAVTLNYTSCDPGDTGTVVQNLLNVFGCDSIVTEITSLLPSDDVTLNYTSCDPGDVGTVVQNLTNEFGCDSIVTEITTLLPSDDVAIFEESCEPGDTGIVVQNLTNEFGCDSVVTTTTSLVLAYDVNINESSCNPGDTGTVVQNLMAESGCDSIVTTITSLLPSDAVTINELSCDPGDTGTVVQNLTNVFGCDSVVTTITGLDTDCSEPCDDVADLAVGNISSNSADLSWTAGGGESDWDVELVDITGGGSFSGTPTDNTDTEGFPFTGLDPDNTYEAYVRGNCGESPEMVISGVMDGPLSGGIPKFVELYAIQDIADASLFGFGSANNGGGSDGEEWTAPAVAITSGSYIYIATDSQSMVDFFGGPYNGYISGAASINGDDAIELFKNGEVIDVFGDINVDGNGEPWEYLDGWAYRVSSTGPDGSTFNLANWTFSGPNALDGETDNATAAVPVPIGTYTFAGRFEPSNWVGPIEFTTLCVSTTGDMSGDPLMVPSLPYTDIQSTETCFTDQAGGASVDVWYQFTTSANADSIIATTCADTSNFNTTITVIDGITDIGFNDDDGLCPFSGVVVRGGSLLSTVALDIDPSTTYLIRVEGSNSDDDGIFELTVTEVGLPAGGPANDSCEAAIEVFCDDAVAGTTTDASDAPDLGTCGVLLGNSPAVWYSFTGTGDDVTFSTCTGTDFDTKISVFSGDCDALVCEDGNDDECSLQSEIEITTAIGVEYFIIVTGFDGDESGDFTLTVTCEPVSTGPANDSCQAAIEIFCDDMVAGTTNDASNATDLGFCGTDLDGAPAVWYHFSGTDEAVTFSTCDAADFDTKIGVFSGDCGALVCEGGNDDGAGCSGFTSELTVNTLVGTDYYIVITGYDDGEFGDFTLTVTCASIEPCSAGTWTNTDSVAICEDSTVTVTSLGDSIIPAGGQYGIFFSPGPGGSGALGGEFVLLDVSTPFTFDYTLNGILPANFFPNFAGTWYVYGAVYTDPGDAFNTICHITDGFTVVTFLDAGEGVCAPPPPAPENDSCQSAIEIFCDDAVAGTTIDASDAPDLGFCGTAIGGAPAVWYHFSGTDEAVTFSTCDAADFDTKIGVFSGDCGALVCESGNDDSGGCTGFTSEVTVNTAIGTDYYVIITGFNSGEFGDFTLSVTCSAIDPCFAGTWTNTDSVAICQDSTVTVTSLGDSIIPAGGQYGIFFQPGPGGSGALGGEFILLDIATPYTFDYSLNGILPDNLFPNFAGTWYVYGAVYTDPFDAFNSICHTTDEFTVVTFLEPGEGDCPAAEPAPVNDTCTGAIALTIGLEDSCPGPDGFVSTTTATATQTLLATCDGFGTDVDIWYTFTATSESIRFNSITGAPGIEIFELDCDSLISLACINNASGIINGLTIGNDYLVMIWTDVAEPTVEFCVEEYFAPPAPENDACDGAIEVFCDDVIDGTTISATADDAPATCGTSLDSGPGVWYQFSGDGDDVTFSLCGSSFDTKIGVFSGDCDELACEGGNDDACGLQSETTVTTVPNTDYFVYVTGFGAAAGDYTLTVTCSPPIPLPANDTCSGAIDVACGDTIIGSTIDASDSDLPGTCNTGASAPGVWYHFSGTGDEATFSLCGSSFDTKIHVYSGTCDALVCEDGNDDFCSLQSQVTINTTFGVDYYIYVSGFGSNTGEFELAISCPPPAECDEPTNIVVDNITDNSADISWTPGGDESLWDIEIVDVTNGGVFTGVPTASGLTSPEYMALGLLPANDYEVWVRADCGEGEGDSSNWVGPTPFTTLGPPAPENDLCTGAITVTCGSVTAGSTIFATTDDIPGFCGTSVSAPGVWYYFEGNGDDVTFSTCNDANYDTKISVYSGDCTELSCEGGNDDASGCSGFTSETTVPTTVGTDYFIYVHGFSSNTGDFNLSVSCFTPPPAPDNDLCEGAIDVTCESITSGSTEFATITDAPADCGTSLGAAPGIWYHFEGTDQDVTFSTCDAASFDTKIGVFSGECEALTCVDGNDDGPGCSGFSSEIEVRAYVGTDYYIYVTGYNGSTGDFDLSVTCEDTCEAIAIVIDELLDVTCFAPGEINITVTSGTGPFDFSWSDGSDSEDLTATEGGDYSVTITGSDGCVLEAGPFTLGEEPAPGESIPAAVTSPGCSLSGLGSIDVTIGGGTPPYDFLWSSGDTTEDLTDLASGTYTLTVTDQTGCVYVTQDFVLSDGSTLIELAPAVITDVDCHGNATGAIDVTIGGGTPPYTYRWSNDIHTEDVDGVEAGEYWIIVEDASGCSILAGPYVVSEPDELVVSGGTSEDALCFEEPNGSVTGIEVSGGTEPYSYLWSDGSITLDVNTLLPGVHQLTLTDANGCEAISAAFAVSTPAKLGIPVISITDANCAGDSTGSVDITVAGGTAPYTYAWSDGSTDEDLSGAPAGDYTVTITDDNECEITSGVITISEPSMITVSSVLTTEPFCFGGDAGSIDITVLGGSPPYTYSWDNGEATQDIDGLVAGDYIVTITDANGCVVEADPITIFEPFEITIQVEEITTVSCYEGSDGSIDVIVQGGTFPYSFLWSTGSTNDFLFDVPAGTYFLTVTDAFGCTVTSEGIVISGPDPLEIVSIDVVDNECNGAADGEIDVEVTGGTPPLTFSWDSSQFSEDLSGLEAGEYTLTITDDNGCQLMTPAIEVEDPAPIFESLPAVVSNTSCNGEVDGSIEISLQGGTLPYDFDWSNGSTDEDPSGLEPGDYSVTVTDFKGCVHEFGPYTVEETDELVIAAVEIKDASCLGEPNAVITIEVEGGTPPYSYEWSNGETSQDLIAIGAGDYSVIITDHNGCSITSEVFTVGEPGSQLSASFDVTNASDPGISDGAIDMTVSGGDGPYSFEWNSGDLTEDLDNIGGGEYCVTVTDANGCAADFCVEVGVGTAIIDLLQLAQLDLYPNPTRGLANLKIAFTQSADIQVQLVDVLGRVLEDRTVLDVLEREIVFDVADFAAGTYFVRIVVENNSVTLPLVVQH